jgi:formylglycine-generating enzyme required for sulfatase activity
VGSLPLCVARYPGVFDLIGNAAEWVDSCRPQNDAGLDPTGKSDYCASVGGGIYGASRYYCDTVFRDVHRDLTNETFGFRCCAG